MLKNATNIPRNAEKTPELLKNAIMLKNAKNIQSNTENIQYQGFSQKY